MTTETKQTATPEFMAAARMADRYSNEQGSKQYKAATTVIRLNLEGKAAEICSRCSGAGGYKHWPGFKCFKCGGSGIDRS